MIASTLQLLLAKLARSCEVAGFDLTAPFDTAWFNAVAAADERLPDFGRRGALAVVIANSRALWPVFLDHLQRHPQHLDAPEPLDTYSEDAIPRAAAASLDRRHTILWSHQLVPRAVPMQRLARIAGLAHLSPANLCVHPTFGPWIGLRAVLVVDADGPGGVPTPIADPCGACTQNCLPAFRAVVARPPEQQDWRDWLAVRQACPLGAEWRYDEAQAHYHYTKDRVALRSLVASHSPH